MNRMRLILGTIAVLLLPMWLLISCGDETNPNGTIDNTHVINYTYAQSADDGKVYCYLDITRNNEPFNTAAVGLYIDTDTIPVAVMSRTSDQGAYAASFNAFELDTSRIVKTKLNTPVDQFNFTDQIVVPDTFSFDAPGLPDNIVRASDASVPLEWTASARANGYFVIVMPADEGNTAAGYSALVSGTSVSVPISAYQNNLGFSTGDYNVWVVAYRGSPVDSPDLPFAIPAGFANNITRVGVSGKAGALFVAARLVLSAQTE